eukprot:1179507-Prorocentrum_minimum.AAC.2
MEPASAAGVLMAVANHNHALYGGVPRAALALSNMPEAEAAAALAKWREFAPDQSAAAAAELDPAVLARLDACQVAS